MSTKRCKTCGETKPHSEYNARPAAKDGLWGECKACVSIRRKRNRRQAKGRPKPTVQPTDPDRPYVCPPPLGCGGELVRKGGKRVPELRCVRPGGCGRSWLPPTTTGKIIR